MAEDELAEEQLKARYGGLGMPATIMGIVVTLGLVVASFVFLSGAPTTSLEATGRVTGPDFAFEAGSCTTGVQGGVNPVKPRALPLDGVRIVGKDGGSVLVNRNGDQVWVKSPACKSHRCKVALTAEQCRLFDVDLGSTGKVVNNTDIWAGKLKLECDVEGGLLTASVDFPACA